MEGNCPYSRCCPDSSTFDFFSFPFISFNLRWLWSQGHSEIELRTRKEVSVKMWEENPSQIFQAKPTQSEVNSYRLCSPYARNTLLGHSYLDVLTWARFYSYFSLGVVGKPGWWVSLTPDSGRSSWSAPSIGLILSPRQTWGHQGEHPDQKKIKKLTEL